jgi:hypothetical protein
MTEQRDENGRILVDSPSEVPPFADDDAAAFWETHTPSATYLRQHRLTADSPAVKRLRERIPPRTGPQAG